MKRQFYTFSIPILTLTFRVVVGTVFIYAGLDKIQYSADFALAVQNYEILPDMFTNLVAIILPWLELICGLFILAGLFLRESAGIISALTIIFIFALLSALLRGLDINCGCYGIDTHIGWDRILEDVGLLVMAVYTTLFPVSPLSLDQILNSN